MLIGFSGAQQQGFAVEALRAIGFNNEVRQPESLTPQSLKP